ncbi:MAG: glycosyltransferase, partial [Caldimonas sp.]
QVDLAGQRDNREVREHYATKPVDAFVLLSEQEGLPVSIQEAMSAGIPIVATAVGGVAEAVGADNGVLLGPDPALADVVDALERVVVGADAASTAAWRQASRQRWERDFDAERNHSRFAELLRARAAAL